MAFREVIEAVLRAKDANRFKAGMEKAAKSVRKLGRDEEEAAAQTELLKEILEALDKQAAQTTIALAALAQSVDEVGDEMVETAAKTAAANVVMKKSGSNAVFLGKSWAFWKDRLSLTRSEILTTSITIATYFSPAILAMGSSFAYAAVGGGGVALGGLSTLLFGLGVLSTVLGPVTEGIDKIMKAQDQYTQAVNEYGAVSEQASRANAHLYGVIQTQGGRPVFEAVKAIRSLSEEWKSLTAPARADLLGSLRGGVGFLQNLLPTLATGARGMARGLRTALGDAFDILDSNDFRATLLQMAQTFDKAIGPGLRGFANVIIVIGRIIRAVSPFVVEWAEAWEDTTKSWRRGTRDGAKLRSFFSHAVDHFKAWWGLAKALATTLRLIFRFSKDEGLTVVGTLTELVTKFNLWLEAAGETGKIDRFWEKYNRSVEDAVWALQNPIEAINRWLPKVMDAIATTLATHAPHAAGVFIRAFLNSGSWAQLLTVAWFAKKFGFFKAVGRIIGGVFLGPFTKAFVEGFAPRMAGAAAAEGAIGRASAKAGRISGAIFGRAFAVAALVAIGALLTPELEKLEHNIQREIDKEGGWIQTTENILSWWPWSGRKPWEEPGAPDTDGNRERRRRGLPGGQFGGIIPPGGQAIVGERGMELATTGPRGTQITPLGRNSRHTLPQPMLDLPNLENQLHVSVFSTIQVDRREIARAVADQAAYETARRGGHRASDG